MRIQNNIAAMNAGRNLRKNQKSLNKNLEKLSSGYRIVRSADDAAGLAISESMRATIACYEQSENNAQDGISLVQTADGAMQEIHAMLDRMMTLASQAANGTLNEEDRLKIQEEVDEILKEISRIKNDTEFNGLPLLQGDEGVAYAQPAIMGGLPDWVECTQGGELGAEHTTTETWTSATGTPNTGTATVKHAAAMINFNNNFDKDSLLGDDVGFYSTCCTCDAHYSIKFTDGDSGTEASGTHTIYKIDISGVNSADDLVQAIIDGTNNGHPGGHYTRLDRASSGVLVIYDERPKTDFVTENSIPSDAVYTPLNAVDTYGQYDITTPIKSMGYGLFAPGIAYDKKDVTIGDIYVQVGESDSGRIAIDLPDVTLNLLQVNGLNVTSATSAQYAISSIEKGVAYLSGERARMGAYQNRLEHSYNHLGNAVENLTQSESRIRDADVAEQMMEYTKNNILIQSAQSMLAQSNQVPQGVLQLMQ